MPAQHLLPAPLANEISRLGDAIENGAAPRELLDSIRLQLAMLPPRTVPAVEREIVDLARLYRSYDRRPSLLHMLAPKRTHLDLLTRQPDLAPIFLFHRDGFVREAALTISQSPPASPFEFSVIAWRLNDWVRPVRIAARHYAERLFPLTAPKVIAGSAPFLLDRWRHWGRWDEVDMAVVDAALQRRDVAADLADQFRRGATGPLGTMLQYALRGPSLDEHLETFAMRATQSSVRAAALRVLISGHARWPAGYEKKWIDKSLGVSRRVRTFATRTLEQSVGVEELIAQGLGDPSPTVRRVAADGLIEHRASFTDVASAVAKLAVDKSPALRERAHFLSRHMASA